MVKHSKKGYASALLDKAKEIAKEHRCYKLFGKLVQNKEGTLNFNDKNNGFEIDRQEAFLFKKVLTATLLSILAVKKKICEPI